MDMRDYIRVIQEEIRTKKSYDEYGWAFSRYKDFLEVCRRERPRDIEVCCQLAAVYFELRYDLTESIGLLEHFLSQYDEDLTDEERERIYTNLGFFYEEDGEVDLSESYLEKAVALEPTFPNAYHGLGLRLIEKGELARSFQLFQKASSLSEGLPYKYNYGVALYQNGQVAEAGRLFEGLSLDEKFKMRALYGSGCCLARLGEKVKVKEIADQLCKMGADDDIGESEIADLYYQCDYYFEHNQMYKTSSCPYYPDKSWLGPYFYSLAQLGSPEELEAKFLEVCYEKDEDMKQNAAEELDEDFSRADQKAYLEKFQKEKQEIEDVYWQVKNRASRPRVEFKMSYDYGCYLLDCPRHQKIC